jgi:hypothetical protein
LPEELTKRADLPSRAAHMEASPQDVFAILKQYMSDEEVMQVILAFPEERVRDEMESYLNSVVNHPGLQPGFALLCNSNSGTFQLGCVPDFPSVRKLKAFVLSLHLNVPSSFVSSPTCLRSTLVMTGPAPTFAPWLMQAQRLFRPLLS